MTKPNTIKILSLLVLSIIPLLLLTYKDTETGFEGLKTLIDTFDSLVRDSKQTDNCVSSK